MPDKVVIGDCELWHGDCREVLPLLADCDLMLTDPPYGINENRKKQASRQGHGMASQRAAEMLRKLLPASPAQRQPLTQDEILDMAEGVSLQFHDLLEFARAIEAAHGITAALAAQKGEPT